ncbi:carbohydrate ABC transporter ATP-binding protein, CUT1 family [Tistlia consotensis]|uniref:Carbohydrate ABC transporter ATP-binding protein, CUT1 family n=1 Tax=Tistlia consotensis USBA 355 TaxID=560819 RepID=A0A1Y6BV63_9PROT|nr:ABC transporter ATP-binding protein [Tistlia consotensis]SMF21896.1 carbohydrate ABC transporter ATP-binding protein, CUT1 family [Tistlia consotensis USBA 355]SNR46468.1 carbohydrate ABC transporter ATP-binding protein, CUT1 family [Tistlia consotensis]
MSFLILDRLSKSFGAVKVFDGLSLAVAKGETVAICSPSGSGKTLLLRLIAGIYEPDAGEILIDGKAVTGLAPDARGIGMAFQNFALYPHLTAFENIASPLRARGVAEAELTRRVGRVAEILKIGHVLRHLPRELSNGQKQRTALARAIVADARLLLLDDPLRNVDAKLRYEMRHELPRVLREFEATVLYVTQDFREAMALGRRIGVLHGGGFVQVDRPQRIYADPETVEVARLFGDPTINLYDSELAGGAVSLLGLTLGLPGAADGGRRPCRVGVRPEHVELDAGGEAAPDGGAGGLPVTIEAVTPLNQNAVLLLQAAGGGEILASTTLQRAEALARGPRRAIARVRPEHLLLFDRDSGARIRTG